MNNNKRPTNLKTSKHFPFLKMYVFLDTFLNLIHHFCCKGSVLGGECAMSSFHESCV